MKNLIFKVSLIIVFLIILPIKASSQTQNWTHFRGSNLDGIAISDNIPVEFNDTTHIKWKAGIPGRGWSSPVVYENQIWITTANNDGKELYAVCIDFETGKIVHNIRLFAPENVIRKHSINSYATPTSAIEKGFVYIHFGSPGTACINTSDGSVVWSRDDFECNHVQGPGSSAFLYKDLLILHYEGTDVQYLVALNKSDGKLVWKTDRPEEPYIPLPTIGKKAYITPLLINVKGRDMLISNGSAVCIAYDPMTGKEIWRVVRGAETTVAMPFFENGIVYFYTGFMVKEDGSKFSEILAVNPDGSGDITETNIIWKKEVEFIQLLTPVIKNGIIYTIDTRNTLIGIDAVTGDNIFSSPLKNKFNASPIYAAGKIYFSSIGGEVLVLEAGRELKVIATNQMDGEIWATPAILRNSILMRTDKNLYRIGY